MLVSRRVNQQTLDTNGNPPGDILGVSQFPGCQTVNISKGSSGGIDRFENRLKVGLGYKQKQRNQAKNRRFMTSM